ncbi:hypothetical protein HAX54_006483, partial [Datura stramonium]|nr:hypothetical protein [Datura stramonium]
MGELGSLMKKIDINLVQSDCNWPLKEFRVEAPSASESIMSLRPYYTFVYTYPFIMGLDNHIDELPNGVHPWGFPFFTRSHALVNFIYCNNLTSHDSSDHAPALPASNAGHAPKKASLR